MEQLTFEPLWECKSCKKKDDQINQLENQINKLSHVYRDVPVADLYTKILNKNYLAEVFVCEDCRGMGKRDTSRDDTYGMTIYSYGTCPDCNGKGKVVCIAELDRDIAELHNLLTPIYKKAQEKRTAACTAHKMEYLRHAIEEK